MPAVIVEERPDSPAASQLIAELEAILNPLYAPESRHGLSVEKLLRERVPFFVIRQDGQPAGCGGVQLFGTDYGEVKRMYVRPPFRGLGLGHLLLEHQAAYCQQRGVALLRLETGIHQVDAIRLYERFGFQRIAPFGEYRVDAVSLCYEKRLV